MGNQNSTLTALSTNPSINGLVAFVQPLANNTGVTLTNNPNVRATRFVFNDFDSVVFFANTEFGNDAQRGTFNPNSLNQPILFSDSPTTGPNLQFLRVQGLNNTNILTSTSSASNGQPLRQFYTCGSGSGAQVQLGTSVPSGCSELVFRYNPRPRASTDAE